MKNVEILWWKKKESKEGQSIKLKRRDIIKKDKKREYTKEMKITWQR